jgi:hypothetical protein
MDFGKAKFRCKSLLKKLVLTFLSFRTSWEGVQMNLNKIMAEILSKNTSKSKNKSKHLIKCINWFLSATAASENLLF